MMFTAVWLLPPGWVGGGQQLNRQKFSSGPTRPPLRVNISEIKFVLVIFRFSGVSLPEIKHLGKLVIQMSGSKCFSLMRSNVSCKTVCEIEATIKSCKTLSEIKATSEV